jgi:Protein of unknown function (DUF3551)
MKSKTRALLMAAGAGLLAFTAFTARPAQAYEAPWCAVIDVGTGNLYWDCQYDSIAACRPNVIAGNRGSCVQNPHYRGLRRAMPRR